MSFLHVIFWAALAFCGYTLAGYWVLLMVAGRLLRRRRLRLPIEPTVSILIAVRDAEHLIEQKVRNCLALNYEREKLEVIVACDGPSPATAEIVNSFQNPCVRCASFPRQGKSAALSAALPGSAGSIVVFTDVSVRLDAEGLRTIVSNFADSRVGCVTSEDVTSNDSGNAEPMYVSFDRYMRRLESNVRTLVGASGSFFAVRRELCRDLDPELANDFLLALRTIEAGYDVVVDPAARGFIAAGDANREFDRKVRTVVNGIDTLLRHFRLLNPFRYGWAAWELASHKLFRWLLPFAFLITFVSNCLIFNSGKVYVWTLLGQSAVYGIGGVSLAVTCLQRFLPLRLAAFFVMGCGATLRAWWDLCRGERHVAWEPTHRSAVSDQQL